MSEPEGMTPRVDKLEIKDQWAVFKQAGAVQEALAYSIVDDIERAIRDEPNQQLVFEFKKPADICEESRSLSRLVYLSVITSDLDQDGRLKKRGDLLEARRVSFRVGDLAYVGLDGKPNARALSIGIKALDSEAAQDGINGIALDDPLLSIDLLPPQTCD